MNKTFKPLVLILCGGRSLRLWPLSEYKSKNFINIFGFSPLEATLKRFLKVTSRDRIFLVANQKEKQALIKSKLVQRKNIFLEPDSKNTAPAVLLALCKLGKLSEENIIISPVDHFIKEEEYFYTAVNKALKTAADGFICTLGIEPKEATSQFGYIQVYAKSKNGVFSVKKFIEKPSLHLAKMLIAQGKSFYNSGMFVAPVSTLLQEYKRYYPDFHYFQGELSRKKIIASYKRIKDLPFDKAIMEKTKKAKLIKARFSWKDFGNWQAVYDVLAKDKKGNVKKGKVSISQGGKNFIYVDNPGKKVLVIGLNNLFFVDTKDYALLLNPYCVDSLKKILKDNSKILK
ncbi:MAG: sugar phosphate nucleotidyltransferase [Candidatus Omnitrophica bacterium]|nr:sugar phosphate nucleotidyltransferase [Candidatus Omnitrophota bacterium]MDD5430120.1 sugar phosphate nucleotidyltransferase [Candidatus Omnitrophota bacterium]